MAKIISIHSFRGGTGKSNITANIAVQMAMEGKRVGVIDTDIQSPGIHILFGLDGADINVALNDYLWHDVDIQKTSHDVTPKLNGNSTGRVFLIPSSIKPGEITRVLREGYDAKKLTYGLRRLVDDLALDVLLIDTHPGLNEETMLSIVISHTLLVIMRPDQQDFEGTSITVKVARQLEIPNMLMIVNKTPPSLSSEAVQARVEKAYDCEVAGVLPHSNEMLELASRGIFSLHYPNDPVTALYQQIASRVME
jgi:septum site-determining protein MinD